MSELPALHDDLVATIADLAALTARDAPDEAPLAATRYKLTRLSTARRRAIEMLCAQQISRLPPHEADRLRRFQEEITSQRGTSSRHISEWSPRDIVKNWPGYCAASATMRAAMLAQIDREKALLYPLIGADGR
ncbi:hypothetical protein AB2M62_06925 [Sphingomonas sp. MMS12-HWE2-04]|uniref:hypothetical protein n=1 Tax=Sphingomonas sp. MMS12-HWE2-04 TaxID=3234199 RepID=UPI00384EE20B